MEEKRWISSKILFTAILEQLAEGRQAAFTVTGMSMWPFICHGRDQVILEAVKPTEVKIGDIVLIRISDERYMLHRITKLQPEGFETTGDGNCFRDGLFPYSFIAARVTHLIRKGKKIDCNNWKWKFVFRCWMLLFPIRKWLLKFLRRISAVIHRK